ncbi:unnamed protein product [Allacma fusca]|uniref:Uncharacterized protein n=1 Tax=Allacma fusca TaxID=39272 RepID=A0A8J2JTS3_9HEXA|nr:unnamed protein product [Allacma fusca]
MNHLPEELPHLRVAKGVPGNSRNFATATDPVDEIHYPSSLKLDSSLGPRPKTIVTISSQLGSRSRSVYVPQNPDPDLDIIESSVTKREPTPTLVPKSKAIIIEELFGFPDEDSCGCPVVGCDGDGEDDNTLRRCEDTPTPSVSVPSTLPANESLPSTTNTCPS